MAPSKTASHVQAAHTKGGGGGGMVSDGHEAVLADAVGLLVLRDVHRGVLVLDHPQAPCHVAQHLP